MQQPLKIYAGQDLFNIEEASCWLMLPFKQNPHTVNNCWFSRGIFQDFIENGKQYLQLTSLKDADIVIAPNLWLENKDNSKIITLHKHIQNSSKSLLILYPSDNQYPIKLNNTLILSSAIEPDFNENNFNVSTYPVRDLLKYYNNEKPLLGKRSSKPVINFCGRALHPHKPNEKFLALKKIYQKIRYSIIANVRLEQLLTKLKIPPTKNFEAKIRAQSTLPFKKDQRFETNLMFNHQFMNGAIYKQPIDFTLLENTHKAYSKTIFNSDFVPCPRGAGNFSLRFYETLSAGRIPIFINTGCTLPFENIIDWKKYTVWIEEHQLHKITDIVYNYYHSLSEDAFIQKQKDCRKLWEDYLSPLGFASKLHLIIKNHIV